jgi:hypothetical protein
MGSVVLPHLHTAWHVDQAILSEEDRLVVIRFGRDADPDCMRQDEVLYRIADRVKNFAVIYLCDIDEVPDFKGMYVMTSITLAVNNPTRSRRKSGANDVFLFWIQVRIIRSHDDYVFL